MVFALAGMSNMCAAAITNPVNVIKVRMQLDGALAPSSQVLSSCTQGDPACPLGEFVAEVSQCLVLRAPKVLLSRAFG